MIVVVVEVLVVVVLVVELGLVVEHKHIIEVFWVRSTSTSLYNTWPT